MPKTRPLYSPEFRRRMVELFRAGRDPDDLAREFEPTAQSICHWVIQADRQDGRREEKGDGLDAAQRDELAGLLRENRRRFASRAEARMACFSFIEGWYNTVRLHSALGYRSPMAYEAAQEKITAEPK